MNKRVSVFICLMLTASAVLASESIVPTNKAECKIPPAQSLIFKDDFKKGLAAWVTEYKPSAAASIRIHNNKLLLDVDGGATVWLKQPLSGNYKISYTRKVIMQDGKNDRLSDLNQFWMATDPHSSQLFTRSGVFEEYDGLRLYYAGIGGNTNSTSRFRKYIGTGERVLLADLQDSAHMLKPNHNYQIDISVYRGCTELRLDGQVYFTYQDPEPLLQGYFGFRTTQSRQEIDRIRIYRLAP